MTTTPADEVTTGHIEVTDEREVVVEIACAPLVYTPKGRSPMQPSRVLATITRHFRYSGEVYIHYEVWGKRINGVKAGDYLRRSYTSDRGDAPDWMCDLIAPHVPVSWVSGISADGGEGEQS